MYNMDLEDSYYITKLKITEPQQFNQLCSKFSNYITKLKITEPQLKYGMYRRSE